jgi:hypothetical protein
MATVQLANRQVGFHYLIDTIIFICSREAGDHSLRLICRARRAVQAPISAATDRVGPIAS